MEATAEITAAVKNVPALRFLEFEGEWVKKKIKDISPVRSGSTPLRSNSLFFDGGIIPWVKTTDLNNSEIYETEECVTDYALNNTSIRKNPVNSVLVAMYGGFNQIGRTGLLKVEACTNQALSVLNPYPDKVLPQYLLHWLNAKVDIWRSFAGSSRKDPNITGSDVAAFPIIYPTISEQQKIASFLTIVDDKIQQLSKKRELLEKYKKGVIQQIFSQQIRFKDENGQNFPEWDEKNGDIIFENISDKNHNSDLPILAITQEYGAIPRDLIDYNVSVTDKSIESYKVVQVGDFIISLRSFQGGIEYSNYKGLCSPAYIILRPKKDINRDFFKFYFKTEVYISLLNKKLEGIRDGKMISYKYFSDIKLPLPSLSEQIKIASFISAVDNKITLLTRKLEQAQQFKKGLLQQLFV